MTGSINKPFGINIGTANKTINALTNSGSISVTNTSTQSTADTSAIYAVGIYQIQASTLKTLINTAAGQISAVGTNIATGNAYGISNFGTIGLNTCGGANDDVSCNAVGLLKNSGAITVSNNGFGTSRGINNGSNGSGIATIYRIDNIGTISAYGNSHTIADGAPYGPYDAIGIYNHGTGSYVNGNLIGAINNSGSITSDRYGIQNNNAGSIHFINNTGLISITSTANIDAVTAGNTNVAAGILNVGSTIGSLVNSGSIGVDGDNRNGIINASNNLQGGAATITVITNTGTIAGSSSGGYSIVNTGSIGTLNNSQGAGNVSGALTYYGTLPANYNNIISSPTSFGRLAVTSATGTTTFGIYSGSTVRNGTYASVLTGITSSNLMSTTGTYGSASWVLSNSSGSIWDLIISGIYTGPSVANTNQSLVNAASTLQGTYTLQNSVLANSFSYDCNVFGANDVCVSGGGRNTAVSAANGLNNTSALLIAAYRAMANVRVGGYADQNLSVNNAGAGINLGNNTPLLGLFAAWNEKQDGTGTEVKASLAYGQKNTTMTRGVVGSGATASEAGSGSSQINSQGAQVTAKYGFGITDQVVVSPYVGIRYTQNNMGGYTEGASSTVTAPLSYSALNTNATTALAGVGAQYKGIPQTTLFASAGVETDTNTSNGSYNATNASIGAIAPVNFNPNPVKTRPTAMLGAGYDVEKNQRFGVTGIYRQESYQATASTTVMATYTVGL
ncbi:beta strand repeat-containing protein [Polynucleobacter corsicus]|uniref:beta strand repeat-containing protein n=1 Tax=Polynucleobacter corsicus TaxID=2081042 RepID=UPI001BFCFA51|nr:autotransporter outer membrane beta-barrel domain-containing protein [Polynucleobacter corsicus]QWE19205.1 autotransporter outer membrane beta-barrel domain-containing protein [Polynucleobacter corsicus]